MTDNTGTKRDVFNQDVVLAFLGGAEHGMTRIDTHASIVFLGSDRALKVKRNVRLPFLDYSSLEKRRDACMAELDVNKPLAPELYRRVVPITNDPNGLTIDGEGPIVEWAVEMKRFDENVVLDRIAASAAIPPALAEKMASAILSAHDRAAVSAGTSWLASIGGIIDRNTVKFREVEGLTHSAIEQLHHDSHAAHIARIPILEHRARAGFVRRCHGDLHLGNIALIDHKPVLFDAIEFDAAIATTDILYDLGFVLMDLTYYGQLDAANVLFNHYLAHNDLAHLDALSLLPLFLSLRAAIRAHVLFTKWEQSGRDREIATQAKQYFDLACRLIRPPAGGMVAIGGPSGTGKSVLARAVAPSLGPAPGAIILRSDVVRKAMFGVPEYCRLPTSAYTTEVTDKVYNKLLSRARRIVQGGHAVVIDAAFLHAAERRAFALVEPHSSAHLGFFLTAGLAVRLARIAGRHHDASDATAAVAHMQETFNPGDIEWAIIKADGTPEQTLAQALLHLAPLTPQRGG